MATPLSLRADVGRLTDRAERDLAVVWRQVTSAEMSVEALNDVLPGLIDRYGSAVSLVAAQWYDELRSEQGVRGRFRASPARMPDPGVPGLVGWAQREATSLETMGALVGGGVQKRITNAARNTIAGSSRRDPASTGWKRVGTGACGFCRMLITRDAVYTEATANFASHDNCRCQAYPMLRGARPINVRDYLQSERPNNETERAAAREWIATNL